MLSELKEKAYSLLRHFKGEHYIHGVGCLDQIGKLCRDLEGKPILIVDDPAADWKKSVLDRIHRSLQAEGIHLVTDRVIPLCTVPFLSVE